METDNNAPNAAENQPKPAQVPLSPHALAKKRRKDLFNKIISVAILIFMVGWVFAAYYGVKGSDDTQDSEQTITIGNYQFYLLADSTFGTYFNVGGKKLPIAFRLDPRNASTISLDPSAVEQVLSAKKVYITFDPNVEDKARMAVASAEIARITSLYNIETVGAYIKDSDPPSENVPIKTCDAGQQFITVIELDVNNLTDTNIKNEKGCVIVSGKTADSLIDAADKLGMNLIGIKL